MAAGHLVISLDFELHWGMRDRASADRYAANLTGVRRAVPAMLELFQQRGIHATWACVGLLFARTQDEAHAHAPSVRPLVGAGVRDPYAELESAGPDENYDATHFAGSLVEQIASTPGQELASHSFAHFNWLEGPPQPAAFEADLAAARSIGARFGDVTRSLVFPYNRYDAALLDAAHRSGVTAFRGNPPGWPWQDRSLLRRAARFASSIAPFAVGPAAAHQPAPLRPGRRTRHPLLASVDPRLRPPRSASARERSP